MKRRIYNVEVMLFAFEYTSLVLTHRWRIVTLTHNMNAVYLVASLSSSRLVDVKCIWHLVSEQFSFRQHNGVGDQMQYRKMKSE